MFTKNKNSKTSQLEKFLLACLITIAPGVAVGQGGNGSLHSGVNAIAPPQVTNTARGGALIGAQAAAAAIPFITLEKVRCVEVPSEGYFEVSEEIRAAGALGQCPDKFELDRNKLVEHCQIYKESTMRNVEFPCIKMKNRCAITIPRIDPSADDAALADTYRYLFTPLAQIPGATKRFGVKLTGNIFTCVSESNFSNSEPPAKKMDEVWYQEAMPALEKAACEIARAEAAIEKSAIEGNARFMTPPQYPLCAIGSCGPAFTPRGAVNQPQDFADHEANLEKGWTPHLNRMRTMLCY